jgi:hypothetical protein
MVPSERFRNRFLTRWGNKVSLLYTYKRIKKTVFLFFWFLAIVLVSNVAGREKMVGYKMTEIAPPGTHPRLLFRPADIPELRKRATTNEYGREALNGLRRSAFGHRDSELQHLRKGDAKWRNGHIQEVKKGHPMWNRFMTPLRNAAVYYQVTGDEDAGFVAAEYFRIWMDAQPPDEQILEQENWGNFNVALAYDCVYELLTPAERKRARLLFGAMLGQPTLDMFDTAWFLDGPSVSGRNTGNWTPICTGNLILTMLAVEGEVNYPPELLQRALTSLERTLNEFIASDGGMYEGSSYATGFGSKEIPFVIEALRQRGIDFTINTNLSRAAHWITYEMLPWGGQMQAVNKCNGNLDAGPLMHWIGVAFNGPSQWASRWSCGFPPMTVSYDALQTLLWGVPKQGNWRPDDWPLNYWFSTIGKVICRSGWQPRDAHFLLTTNPLGAGHTHADNGHFCYADLGVEWFVDSGIVQSTSTGHNLILIDGIGQPAQEGRTAAFIRSADFSNYANIVDTDLKYAYSRVLKGEATGPWQWDEYNSVNTADRRAIFTRGLSGPFIVIADDIRKDRQKHRYEWLGHTAASNKIQVDGHRFTFTQNWDGTFLESRGSGQVVTLSGTIPEGQGLWRGWLLVRGIPHSSRWSNTNVELNGKRLPYNTTYFAVGNFGQGWWWNPILPGGPGSNPEFKLPAGEVTVKLTGQTGSQVAMVLFTRDTRWQTDKQIPLPGNDTVILNIDNALQGERPWSVVTDPRAELIGAFIGPETPMLSITTSKTTGLSVLHAVKETDHAQFLCVAAAYDADSPRTLEIEGRQARIKGPGGVDIVAGAGSEGEIDTDGQVGMVGLAPRPSRYTLISGRRLAWRNTPLVDASHPIHISNDGKTLVVRGTGGTEVKCALLGATAMRVNNLEQRVSSHFTIPKLPDTWNVERLNNGRFLKITGNGSLPLKVHAPECLDLTVNGVHRYFVMDTKGNVWPLLQDGISLYQYANSLNPALLRDSLKSGTAELSPQPNTHINALYIDRHAKFELPSFGPASYNISFFYTTSGPANIQVTAGDKRLNINATKATGSMAHETIANINTGEKLNIEITTDKPIWIDNVLLNPQMQKIEPTEWSIIGPFPSLWGDDGNYSNLSVKAALDHPFSPEKKGDLKAEYKGVDGQTIIWHTCKPATKIQYDFDTGVTFKQIGIDKGDIGYAVTFINSPTERNAQISISCDYWSKGWINGQPLTTERSASAVAQDGATFFSDSPTTAKIHLKKGINILLIKNHGGSGGNRFVLWITNPGDLKFTHTN